MDETELEQWLHQLMRDNDLHEFYNSPIWKQTAAEAKAEQHNECQRCRALKKYKRATVVHHKKYVRASPRLALCKSNLEALCSQCHYDEHHKVRGFTNAERW